MNDHTDEQFKCFLDFLKQLHINIPFVEALSQMPKYTKFLKGLLTNKKMFEEVSRVILSEGSSGILQNKMPKKIKDPRRFTVPCMIIELVN